MNKPFFVTASAALMISTLGCASAKPAATAEAAPVADATKHAEGSCGTAMGKPEGCCGATKKTPPPEGCCGADHKAGGAEGSCGEGSCGAPAPK